MWVTGSLGEKQVALAARARRPGAPGSADASPSGPEGGNTMSTALPTRTTRLPDRPQEGLPSEGPKARDSLVTTPGRLCRRFRNCVPLLSSAVRRLAGCP